MNHESFLGTLLANYIQHLKRTTSNIWEWPKILTFMEKIQWPCQWKKSVRDSRYNKLLLTHTSFE